MKMPLVTISIPTYNSEPFLDKCLNAIENQAFKNIEVNIVDGFSKDNTIDIAKKHGIKKVIQTNMALLGARYEGVRLANGEYVLLLDCDQILSKDCIKRAVNLAQQGYKMLVLEEGVYNPHSFIEKLFVEDRKLIHRVKDFSPFTGVMLPRFYKKSLLVNAMGNIPKSVIKAAGGQDHAIIYYEAWQIDRNIGLLSHAVFHIEPDTYSKIWKKFYRWGKTSNAAHHSRYEKLLLQKERFRSGLFTQGLFKASLASVFLLILKGIPYKLGYYSKKLSH